ncbi:hypothetical protein LX15_001645 [Streptoalloteichus tenebrarius]|uniref:Uncharacterized protein n=1 Tax=Streptoalloteichus tenebrarius (strain ATCC 17920 / DSM 40477 / JCM 4838 / CBS 697.72 / NBRC 16177 / NCIMB 11028 / NRRL B-12390 / A12253. 1 / ISP 5477) TaxID=1933 RepID=A0ABT1HR27_STRSD|nr:hypothetical protein [Streptoalloteichus tenebrarius]MCP2257958.1 hypothetical protein [Streptoalloteichus tenebrarius]BFF01621.1 hypothetical protein GCM10020241_32960 [Streptoalloteichus tenebrarius]
MRREWARLPLSVVLECNRIVAESMNALGELIGRAHQPFEATRGLWSAVMTEQDRLTLTLVGDAGLHTDIASALAVQWMRGGPWLPPQVAEQSESVLLAAPPLWVGADELFVVPVNEDAPEWLSVICRRCGAEVESGPASTLPALLGLFGQPHQGCPWRCLVRRLSEYVVLDSAAQTRARTVLHNLRIYQDAVRALVDAGTSLGPEGLESEQDWAMALDRAADGEGLWADLVEVVTARWLAWRALWRSLEEDHKRWLAAQQREGESSETRPVLRLLNPMEMPDGRE